MDLSNIANLCLSSSSWHLLKLKNISVLLKMCRIFQGKLNTQWNIWQTEFTQNVFIFCCANVQQVVVSRGNVETSCNYQVERWSRVYMLQTPRGLGDWDLGMYRRKFENVKMFSQIFHKYVDWYLDEYKDSFFYIQLYSILQYRYRSVVTAVTVETLLAIRLQLVFLPVGFSVNDLLWKRWRMLSY